MSTSPQSPSEGGGASAPISSSTTSNFFVVVHGLGEVHTFLVKGTRDEVADKFAGVLELGFEASIYSLKPDKRAPWKWAPTGCTELQEEWHLYDAKADVEEDVKYVVDHMVMHSARASWAYYDMMLNRLTEERQKCLKEWNHGPASDEHPGPIVENRGPASASPTGDPARTGQTTVTDSRSAGANQGQHLTTGT